MAIDGDYWLNQWILHGGFFALVLALNTALSRGADSRRRAIVVLLLLFAALYQAAYAVPRLIPGSPPFTPTIRTLLLTASIFAIGPLNFLYFAEILEEDRRHNRSRKPAGLALAATGIAATILMTLEFHFASTANRLFYSGLLAVCLFIGLHLALAGRIFIYLRIHSAAKTRMPAAVLIFTATVLALAALWFFALADVFDTRPAIHAGLTLYILVLFLFSQRYPWFLLMPRLELARERYRKSALREVDLDETISRLTDLMERDQLYAIEDLTLAQLAHEVELSPHQLSELLNSRLNRSFSGFVNEYRVHAAADLLLQDRERSVLEIGLQVGFNSNSAFYKAFRSFQGISPARFRKAKSDAAI